MAGLSHTALEYFIRPNSPLHRNASVIGRMARGQEVMLTWRESRARWWRDQAESFRLISRLTRLSGPRQASRAGRQGRPLPLAFTARELMAWAFWLCHWIRRTLRFRHR